MSGDCIVKLGGSGTRDPIRFGLWLTGCWGSNGGGLLVAGVTVTEGFTGSRFKCAV